MTKRKGATRNGPAPETGQVPFSGDTFAAQAPRIGRAVGHSVDVHVCEVIMSDAGDCFVVLSGQGLFWDGQAWVRDWRAARQFTAPPLDDPWLACKRLCIQLRASLGCYCVPAFIASPEVHIIERPGSVPAKITAGNGVIPRLATV